MEESSVNTSIKKLQAVLLEEFEQLTRELGWTTDPDQAKKIKTEIQEIHHRIAIAGSLLFSRQSLELEEKTRLVLEEKSKVDEAIADLTDMCNFLTAVTAFLALVDEALDYAKML